MRTRLVPILVCLGVATTIGHHPSRRHRDSTCGRGDRGMATPTEGTPCCRATLRVVEVRADATALRITYEVQNPDPFEVGLFNRAFDGGDPRAPPYIHWADDNTLQVDTDTGTQTRMFRFGSAPPAAQEPQWQGNSVAMWEGVQRGRGAKPTGQLRVTTTGMRPGYLRKNGVPYSENARLEEWFETFTEPNGDTWLVDTMIVTDPQYLTQPYATTYSFKKIPDRSGWDPTPCRADEVR